MKIELTEEDTINDWKIEWEGTLTGFTLFPEGEHSKDWEVNITMRVKRKEDRGNVGIYYSEMKLTYRVLEKQAYSILRKFSEVLSK